ncbi:MAG: class I SAM-dependent methyltransferase [Crocinitomicaceae bacterium]
MSDLQDPIGKAILDYAKQEHDENIIVRSELCDDDVIPVKYLFRSFDEFPEIEKIALDHCKGNVLDVGAAAGIHTLELTKRGHDVKAIDTSKGSVEYMRSHGLNAEQINFYALEKERFDTLLFLMNGIGIAGTLNNLPDFLKKCKTLLNPGGRVICDSTDIKYLYENEDGSLWVDLASEYYGNFRYQMAYKEEETPWFDWLYLDKEKFQEAAEKEGLSFKLLMEEDDHFIVELSV